jgi:lipoprotein-anchoring transpeptidase ErfK/SrfK
MVFDIRDSALAMVEAMKTMSPVRGLPASETGFVRAAEIFALFTFLCCGLICLPLPSGAVARERVAFLEIYPAGTVIIKESERRLYFTTGWGTAISYPIAVGKAGQEWFGEAHVSGKYLAPAWTPPPVVRQDHPHFPAMIPGGSPRNPMGAAAITLNRNEVAIHGTTRGMRRTVGTAASYGCIRMYNEDILDLFRRVRVGTRVIAMP